LAASGATSLPSASLVRKW